MSAFEVAADHSAARRRAAEALRQEARNAWAEVDPQRISETWTRQMLRLMLLLTAAQRTAASEADTYLTAVLAEQGIDPVAEGRTEPAALSGVASDGRPLETLLARPAIVAKTALADGRTLAEAMTAGDFLAGLIAHTQVADAGRVADGVALASRKNAGGYTRMVVGATCSRCIILAGRWYRWNAGFNRHPKDDCVHIPTIESNSADLVVNPRKTFDSMSDHEQDKVFGTAGAQAIRGGAGMASVVNARRGMQTAADGRLYTTEAAGRRPRLMPEQIFREAKDRDDAIRLLKLHGFLR